MHEDHPFTLTHYVAYHGPWMLSDYDFAPINAFRRDLLPTLRTNASLSSPSLRQPPISPSPVT